MQRNNTKNNTFVRVYKEVSKIPQGKVSTYKRIAILCGIENPRIVGFALHVNKDPNNIPCHRVIRSDGTLAKGYAFGGTQIQQKLLEAEGIVFYDSNRIDLSKYLF